MSVPLEAEIGVRRLHALCADAVWRRDGGAFAGCYAENGVWKIAGLVFRGREVIAEALGRLGAANERILMTFASPILDVTAGTLTGRTPVVEQVKCLDGSASVTIGIYYERFVECDGQWLFQWRHFDFGYLGPPDLSAPFYQLTDYGPPPALPGADDPTVGLQFGE